MFYFSDSHSLLSEAQASLYASPWLLGPLEPAMAGRWKAQTYKQGALKTAAGLLQHHPHIQHDGAGFTDASGKKILLGHRRETLLYFNSPGPEKEK